MPLLKVLGLETLSYFSAIPFEAGTLVKVPIRGSLKFALVLESKRADENKTEIRKADFTLRKIGSLQSAKFLCKEFLEAVSETSSYFSVSSGGLLNHLLPAVALQNPKLLSQILDQKQKKESSNKKGEVLALQTESDDRFAHYKALVREDFARQKSVFLCLPQNELVEKAREKMERGIEPYVITFEVNMSKNDFKKEWMRASNLRHPVLIIATCSWLFTPRDDFGTLILEEENGRGWQTLSRPFVDLRHFAELFGKRIADRVILGDSVLSISTLWRHKEEHLSEFESVKWRLPSLVKAEIIDMQKATRVQNQEKEWQALSPRLLEATKETISIGGNLFIYASRKGLAPIIVCRDCGTRIACNNCESPMVLHKTRDNNIFKCHQCGEIRDPSTLCSNCQSWNLVALGVGTDKITDELHKAFPELEKCSKIFELHSDVAPTSSKARGIASDFESGRGNILVGTDLALPYLRKKVHLVGLASIDSLFAIPDFHIRERIFRLITEVRYLAKENLLIQSRNPTDESLRLALSGNLTDFYRMEIDDRCSLNYPPFSVFVKISVRGNKNFVMEETNTMKNIFKKWEPAIFSSIHEKKSKQAAVNAVLKIRRESFPDSTLSHLLRSLPPHFEIKINPDNLL